MKGNIKKITFDIGFSLIAYIFLTIVISSTVFIFNVPISNLYSLIAIVLVLIFQICKDIKNDEDRKITILKCLSVILIIFVSIFFMSKTYDTSYDGNSYHKVAIGQLKNGWNPNYQAIEDFNKSKVNKLVLNDVDALWNNHYAKGCWIFEANIYSLTGNIESGKCLNLLVLISSLLLCISYFGNKIKLQFNIILSLLLCLNPVNISQIFTFYNDGIIYSLILIVMIVLLNIIEKKSANKKLNYLLFLMVLVILMNVKFTGLAYGGIVSLVFYIYILINKDLRKKELKNITAVGTLAVLIGILFVGYSTYVKNFVEHSHPLYPLFGDNKVDIMTTNQPAIFKDMNRFEKFMYSNFSKSRNIIEAHNVAPELKIPFTFTKEELNSLGANDLRIGGFGVLFGGILLISIPVILVGMYFLFKKDRELFIKLLLPLLSVLILLVILDDAWWARYLPQFYIVPIISCLLLMHFKNHKINLFICGVIIILLYINLGLVTLKNPIVRLKGFSTFEEEFLSLVDKDNLVVGTTYYDGAIYNVYDINNNVKILSEKSDEYSSYDIYAGKLTIYEKNERSEEK